MSKTFYYIRRQSGGCDYTIGCGISIQTIIANSKEEAIEEAIGLPTDWKEILRFSEEFEDYYHEMIHGSELLNICPDRDLKISSAYLIEVGEETDMIPILKAKFKEAEAIKNEFLAAEKEKAERAQFEKLKKKFDKK